MKTKHIEIDVDVYESLRKSAYIEGRTLKGQVEFLIKDYFSKSKFAGKSCEKIKQKGAKK